MGKCLEPRVLLSNRMVQIRLERIPVDHELLALNIAVSAGCRSRDVICAVLDIGRVSYRRAIHSAEYFLHVAAFSVCGAPDLFGFFCKRCSESGGLGVLEAAR